MRRNRINKSDRLKKYVLNPLNWNKLWVVVKYELMTSFPRNKMRQLTKKETDHILKIRDNN